MLFVKEVLHQQHFFFIKLQIKILKHTENFLDQIYDLETYVKDVIQDGTIEHVEINVFQKSIQVN